MGGKGSSRKAGTRLKATEEKHEAIRAYKLEGHTNKEIAAHFGISLDWAKEICKGLYVDTERHGKAGQFKAKNIEAVKAMIKQANPNIEYVDGYKNVDSKVRVRCLVCGNIFQRSMISIRHGRKTICKKCQQLNAEAKQKAHEQDVLKRKAERHEQTLERARADAKSRREARRHNCPVCGASTTRRKYCSNECCIKANKYIYDPEQSALHEARRRVRMSSQIKDRGISLKKLYERDGGTCWICGMACEYSDSWHKGNAFIAGNLYPSIDHIVPLSRGGAHAWNNVKLAHRICNTKRFCSSPG